MKPYFDLKIWDRLDPCPRDVLLRDSADCDCVFTQSASDKINEEFFNNAPNCKMVAQMAVGYDNVDVPTCTKRGILLTNTPDVLTEATADIGWALLMAAARRVVSGHKLMESGQWPAWHPFFHLGQDVFGATLGIVGAGRIGGAIARRGTAFGMNILYNNRRPSQELETATGAQYCAFDDLLRKSDFVVMSAPLTAETRGLFGAREFALMKETAIFVNIARGAVVNEKDLYEALKAGRPWSAGLDVFEVEPTPANNPLFTLENFVGTPHVGSATLKTRTDMATLTARNAIAAFTGKPIITPVNKEILSNGIFKI
jgi:glyoxylate reductase